MHLRFSKAIKDLLEGSHSAVPEIPWERDWKLISSLNVSLPEDREEKVCSMFLRLSSLFESGICFQDNGKHINQILCFHRGEVKTPSPEKFQFDLSNLSLHKVQKTDLPKWKNLFAPYFKFKMEDFSVYRIQLTENTFMLLADTLPDPWMKKLLADVHERIMRGIS